MCVSCCSSELFHIRSMGLHLQHRIWVCWVVQRFHKIVHKIIRLRNLLHVHHLRKRQTTKVSVMHNMHVLHACSTHMHVHFVTHTCTCIATCTHFIKHACNAWSAQVSDLAGKILKSLHDAIDSTPNEGNKRLSTALVRALAHTEKLVNLHRKERALAPEEWEDLL